MAKREFEEMFPYEETTDQLNAIEDTKHDMESRRVMDRLICGDVGYGKTEIAIRAKHLRQFRKESRLLILYRQQYLQASILPHLNRE